MKVLLMQKLDSEILASLNFNQNKNLVPWIGEQPYNIPKNKENPQFCRNYSPRDNKEKLTQMVYI